MTSRALRVLLLSDTHLGFDLPLRPRVERRRRGPDFFANTERALARARRGEIDLVVHGGDLLYRSKVPARLVEMAFAPLLEVADRGIPVIVVPGNHERSAIPYPLLAAHHSLHILDRPRTISLELGGLRVAIAGFPCERDCIRDAFADLLRASGALDTASDIRLLCLHQTVEGATVGPGNFTFRHNRDVIRGRDIPAGFAAVLAGHIHRAQVLSADLAGRPLSTQVYYSGSVERTSFAERDEPKGYITLCVEADGTGSGRVSEWRFHELPARPMQDLEVNSDGMDEHTLREALRSRLADLDPEAIVRLQVSGEISERALPVLRAASLRALAPPTMTVTLRWPRR